MLFRSGVLVLSSNLLSYFSSSLLLLSDKTEIGFKGYSRNFLCLNIVTALSQASFANLNTRLDITLFSC
jgi:hypothetical protein